MRKAIVIWTLFLIVMGGFKASTIRADHRDCLCRIEEEAESVRCLADDIRVMFRRQFHCSAVVRQLQSTSNDVESAARRVRGLARSRGRACELREAISCLSGHVNDLESLVHTAKMRAARGLDAPLGCTMEIDRMLATICAKVHNIAALVNTMESGYLVPQIPFGHSGVYSNTGFGNGYGGRYSESYGGNYGGGNGYVGSWNNDGGYYRDTLPAPRYTKEVAPGALPGTGVMYAPRNGGVLSPPAGLYGRRGNGIEMTNDGMVLKIGGVPIKLN